MLPWTGIDLDGTLAIHHEGDGVDIVGLPVPRMLEYVKNLLKNGVRVKIMTARVSGPVPSENVRQQRMIQQWTLKHLGQELEVTCKKDYAMEVLYDDRAISVIRNTGIIIEI